METKPNCNEEAFSKFINRARKKLSKAEELDEIKKPQKAIEADYFFEKSNRAERFKKLEAKVKSLLKSDPNTPFPINKLIDHKVYDSLDASAKERYILQLSTDYNKIKEALSKI